MAGGKGGVCSSCLGVLCRQLYLCCCSDPFGTLDGGSVANKRRLQYNISNTKQPGLLLLW